MHQKCTKVAFDEIPILFKRRGYFFLKPTGHLGLIEVTFLVYLPFTHVIVDAAAFAGTP
jgi:hypothetical protein